MFIRSDLTGIGKEEYVSVMSLGICVCNVSAYLARKIDCDD